MKCRLAASALALASAIFLNTTPASAQSSIAGTVVGQVTDESGAAVPGVAVKLVDLSTSNAFTGATNEAGRFNFPAVTPGTYDINFSKAGFSEYSIRKQDVKIGVVLTANASLKIGSTTTTVEVTASSGAELQTMNATVGNSMSQTSLLVLPNLGRDATSMAVLQPATTPGGNAAGAVGDLNTYQLDGANITDDMGGNVTTYQTNSNGLGGSQSNGSPSGVIPTPLESIEEFKVSVSNQTSDFNNSSGAQIQMSTKRGSSQFHGAGYMFYYDNAIGQANSWANNHTPFSLGALTFPDTPPDFPKDHRSRFGGAIGGPLLPKPVLGGKWFFFFNYEALRRPNASTYSASVPTASLREGIVQVPTATAGVYTPINLNNTAVVFNGQTLAPAACPGGPCDPRGLGLNPIVNKIWSSQIPLGNNPLGGDGGYNTTGFLSTLRLPQTSNSYVGRIDHDFSDKEHFYVTYRDYKYVSLTSNQVDIGGVLSGDTLGTPAAKAPRPQQPSVWTAGLVSTLSPNVTNTFVFSYLRQFWQWSDVGGPAQLPGLGGALELGQEPASPGLIPYNVNTQSVRQRFWDGQDKNLRDDVTMLKGNHLFTFGGAYGRNFDYHSRTDNGAGVNNQISYISTNAGNVASGNFVPTNVTSQGLSTYQTYFPYILGILSSTQVMYTRSLPTFNPLPIGTPATDKSIIPYYSVYFQDTWHMKPSFTLTYGLGWNLEMPPYELDGKQVALVDESGQPVVSADFLNQRNQMALKGQAYSPQLGYELVHNVGSGLKYPYNPYYAEFSPRVSFAWNPHASDGIMGKVFGNGKTVIRGGYSRIFGRLNGVDLVLVPLLGPGLLQGVTCVNPIINAANPCAGSAGATPANAFRIGTDGMTAPLAAPSSTISQPFFPGGANPESVDAASLDPNFRPDRADNFTLTIQRELNRHVSLEVGYIGKIIKNEFQQVNVDAVPTNMTLGGQSFANAFGQLYSQMFFSGVAAANVNAQPFFESVLGGPKSAFCTGFASCTSAVASTYSSFIKQTAVADLWNRMGGLSSWTLPRTTYGQAYNGGNPQATSVDMETSIGWGNYNAAFVSLRTTDWHGITTTNNFTYGRALGTGNQVQASSSYTTLNPYDMRSQYGPQPFDYKFLYNLNMYYATPFFRQQRGVIGRVLGGWTLAPLFTAQSGTPWGITYSEGSCTNCQAFGEVTTPGTASISPNSNSHAENAVALMPFTGGQAANYGVAGATGSNIVFGSGAVGTALHSGVNYGLNLFPNPEQVYSEFRPCVLGIDTRCGGGAGNLRTLPTWNLDAQIVKNISVYQERVGAQLFFTFTNILNHFQPSTPTGSSLTSATAFGQITGQSNTPRSLEFGLRIHF